MPPPEPPPPQPAPQPPKPRPQPAPKKPLAAPQPVTEARTAITREEAPPPAPVASAPAPASPAPAPPPAPRTLASAAAPSAAANHGASRATVTAARFDAAYLNNPPPAYPALSRRMREQGRVLLRVLVTADGRAGRIELSESSGSSRLDAAAEAAVARWRFVPARQGDRDVDAWVIVPIVFKLEG
jgi:protein TonB